MCICILGVVSKEQVIRKRNIALKTHFAIFAKDFHFVFYPDTFGLNESPHVQRWFWNLKERREAEETRGVCSHDLEMMSSQLH